MNASKLLDRPHKTPNSNLAQDVGYMWRQCPFPVIAAIHGRCFGGGLQIALGCDFRYSTPDCEYSIMEAKWGIIPDMSGTVTLRDVGRLDWIKELAMTARIIDAEEAVKVGFVSRVVEDPMEEAQKVAKEVRAGTDRRRRRGCRHDLAKPNTNTPPSLPPHSSPPPPPFS